MVVVGAGYGPIAVLRGSQPMALLYLSAVRLPVQPDGAVGLLTIPATIGSATHSPSTAVLLAMHCRRAQYRPGGLSALRASPSFPAGRAGCH
jgi:hypothetical protein